MTVQAVLDWLDSFAPFETAEGFDNVGLLVGDASADVTGVLFCLDATVEAVEDAARMGCNLIVSHHPLLFGGVKRIDYGAPQGRALRALIGGGMHLIAAHTNLDKAPGGVSESLARALGLQAIETTDDPYLHLGTPDRPLTLAELTERVRRTLDIEPRVHGETEAPIRRVAVAPGACGEAYVAALRYGAQVFLTGEIHHHEILDATGRGLVVLEAGHSTTEQPGVRALYQRFQTEVAQAYDVRAHLHP